MSLSKSQNAVSRPSFGENDKEWFPAWVKCYSEFLQLGANETLTLGCIH